MTMFSFDTFNQNEIPNIYLVNPDGRELYNLGTIYDRKFELRYNTLSSFEFTAPKQINGVKTDYYDYLQYRRLIYVDNIANFLITEVDIEGDGLTETKKVSCKSLESTLSYKKLSLFKGYFTFNNSISASPASIAGSPLAPTRNLLGEIMEFIPAWSLTTDIDPDLVNITRNFDITDKSIYDFLVDDVSKTYQCVFVFDSINKTISASATKNISKPTDIYLSFDNLLKKFELKESTEELVTALTVLGGTGVSIRYVNPLGTNRIYNFDYFKTTEWMNQGLVDAITAWEDKLEAYEEGGAYGSLSQQLRTTNYAISGSKTERDILIPIVSASVTAKSAWIVAGCPVTIVNEISASITAGSAAIASLNSEISDGQTEVTNILNYMEDIAEDLAFDNTANFSAEQQVALSEFIIGNTYTNTNISVNNLATEVDIQNQAENLYNQAHEVLSKVSEPRYSFDIDSANFAFLKEYEPFVNQLELGSSITIQLSDTTSASGTSGSITAIVLGIDFNYDDPEDFKLILSNRLRLDDDQFQYSDIFSTTVDAGITGNFNSQKWNNVGDYYDEVLASGQNFATAPSVTGEGSLAIFSGSSGLTDAGALYKVTTPYTPELLSDGATFTYHYNSGNYNIIGKNLYFEASLVLSGSAGLNSNPVFLTLPASFHTSASTSASTAIVPSFGGINLGTGYTHLTGILPMAGGSSLALYKGGNNTALVPVSGSCITGANSTLYISGHYIID